jgi:peptide chain release factor 1
MSSSYSTLPTNTALTGTRLEIRPGDGGADAERFAVELADAFTAHAQRTGHRLRREHGDTRTIVLVLADVDPASWRRFTGVHRVQRVPANDPRGRRHTSTVTVAALPIGAPTNVVPHRATVRVDTFRGTGPGGQHRNTTDSSVRAVHLPTGITVTVTRGRSQHQNRAWALAELTRRLRQAGQETAAADVDKVRRAQIAAGSGSAAAHLADDVFDAKAFTYNTQRNEVVEHATGMRYRLDRFLKGNLPR